MNIKHHLYTSGGTRKCKIGRKYFFTQTSKVKHIFLTEMMDWKTGKASQKDVELFILQTGENNMFVLLNNFPTFIFLSQRAFFTEALTHMLKQKCRFLDNKQIEIVWHKSMLEKKTSQKLWNCPLSRYSRYSWYSGIHYSKQAFLSKGC